MLKPSPSGDVYVPELDIEKEVNEEVMEDRPPTPVAGLFWGPPLHL